ncbi:hypothetical protein BU25DRAFT_456402 [Macroventuria anomochaeta]|uniref:Uncharacterized protein n=1 Tax=Macroventuria anomochaeta TaxID=301207 RepID=A0ACB6S8Y9_9PLEO|nr:uncharacterized protein BU25DRAFT_456402 [Macroventuria anomochaeta]KAF2629982.1 hypothetical protein BU25DRAFT_456402 [Macroventuria anomochaeta]
MLAGYRLQVVEHRSEIGCAREQAMKRKNALASIVESKNVFTIINAHARFLYGRDKTYDVVVAQDDDEDMVFLIGYTEASTRLNTAGEIEVVKSKGTRDYSGDGSQLYSERLY